MPIQLHIQKMKREADVIKKNEKSANDYLTQTYAHRVLTQGKFLGKLFLLTYLKSCKRGDTNAKGIHM